MKNKILFLCLAWFLGLPLLAQAQANVNPMVLKVNGQPVYAVDISLALRNVKAGVAPGQDVSEQQLTQLATHQVVQHKLLAQEARRHGLKPDQERVQKRLSEVVRRAGGREALELSLKSAGLDFATMGQSIAEMDLVNVLITQRVSPKIVIEEREVVEYYEEHKSSFVMPEEVRASHIIFGFGNGTAAARHGARERAEKARERALAGEDFGALAEELTEDGSGPKDGDLGFIDRLAMEKLSPEFASAAFALPDGQISPVVESAHGYHVIKVTERRPAGLRELDEVRERLGMELRQQKVLEAVAALADELYGTAEIETLVDEPAP